MHSSAVECSPLQTYLENLHAQLAGCEAGVVADYIPELARANPGHFGIALVTVDGHVYQVGDSRVPFTIQSISKPFVYGLALEDRGLDAMAGKVDVEPSGEAFNSISLRPDTGRPMNPMINAGAIAAAGMVEGADAETKFGRIVEAFSRYAGHTLSLDEAVYASEKDTGHRNRAIAHLLRGFGILEDAPEETLDVYFRQCAIRVSCRDLAVMGACLANNGVNPITAVRVLGAEHVPRVLSVMGTCGMYDYSGNWVYRVGMPAKSGVGGGVVAVLPGQMALAVFSPRLDEHGNSVRGLRVCERLSRDFGLHLYHSVRATTASVVRRACDASRLGSRLLRPVSQRAALVEHGGRVRIWQLQGDLGFGATESVLAEVLSGLDGAESVILDLEHVLEIDRAACRLLAALRDRLQAEGRTLLFTHTADKYAFVRALTRGPDDRSLFAFGDTDRALEWCETRLLAKMRAGEGLEASVDFAAQDLCRAMDETEIQQLRRVAVEKAFAVGETVFRRGDAADGLYLVREGRVEILLKVRAAGARRLAALPAGTSFGEMGLLGEGARTADARAVEASVLYFLPYDAIPDAARLALMTAFATQLASKLARDTVASSRLD